MEILRQRSSQGNTYVVTQKLDSHRSTAHNKRKPSVAFSKEEKLRSQTELLFTF